MRYLFLTGLFPKEKEKEIIENSKKHIQNAANNLQWELVKGFEYNLEDSFDVINSLYIDSYPKLYSELKIETYDFFNSKNTKKKYVNIGFLNLPFIKRLSRYLSLKKPIKKWSVKNNKEPQVVLAYAMTSIFVLALKYAKKVNSNITTCLIVPDLPQYMNLETTSRCSVKKILKKIDYLLILKNLKYIDKYVFLTEHMAAQLNIKKENYTVVEGVATNIFERIQLEEKSQKNKKIILYTGGLNELYGIKNLVDGFLNTSCPYYQLIICGSGDSEEYIKEKSNVDKRIIYRGLLPRQDILALQKEATLLVNPRDNNEEYTKYSFPSKTLEYMSSGTPLLGYNLAGFPKEYSGYMYLIENFDNITEAINFILKLDSSELKIKGNEAKDFVLNNKNNKIQTQKIISLVNKGETNNV